MDFGNDLYYLLHDKNLRSKLEKRLMRPVNMIPLLKSLKSYCETTTSPVSPLLDSEVSRMLSTIPIIPTQPPIFTECTLEIVLKKKAKTRKKCIPAQEQLQLAMLWRTIGIFLQSDDISLIVDFFREFQPILNATPPLSLSTQWSNDSSANSYIGIPPGGESTLLDVPELSYLSQEGRPDADNLQSDEHDPLGLVQKLSDTAECVAQAMPNSERGLLLSIGVAFAVKSGRASLLLNMINTLTSSTEYLCDVPMHLLSDLQAYVARPQSDKPLTRITVTPYELNMRRLFAAPQEGGLLLSFGKADHGKLGHGDAQVHRSLPSIVEALKDYRIVKMASMSTYAVMVEAKGTVFVCGTGGSSGNLQGHRIDILPQPLEAIAEKEPVIDVACGLGHALFLLGNGRVCSWGNGGNGRLGLGDTIDRAEACMIKDLEHEFITYVQCGASHSLAITSTGTLYTWGKNSQGQCGKGALDDITRPTVNVALKSENIVKVVAGWEHSIALSANGRVYAWGSGYKDSRRGLVPPVLGLGHSDGRTLPEMISSLDGIEIVDIASGWDHCLALDNRGRVLSWGSGQNGHGSDENVTAPCIVPTLENVHIVSITAGCEHSSAISSSGILYMWGHGDGGRLGFGDNEGRNIPTPVTTLQHMNARPLNVHCGDKFTLLTVDPSMEAWEVSDSHVPKINNDSLCTMTWLHSTIDKSSAPAEQVERAENVISPSFSLASIESDRRLAGDEAELLSCSRFELAQWMLSLMCRAYEKCPSEEDGPPRSAEKEYCVEITVQTFRALLLVLKRELDALFGDKDAACSLNDRDFVQSIQESAWPHSESTCPVALHWSVLRCVLHVLRMNLRALCDMCRVEMTKRALSKLASNEVERLQPEDADEEEPEDDDDLDEDEECGEDYDCDDYDGYDMERQEDDELGIFGGDDDTSSYGERNRDESRNFDDELEVSADNHMNVANVESEDRAMSEQEEECRQQNAQEDEQEPNNNNMEDPAIVERLSIASSNERAASIESHEDAIDTGRYSPALSNASLGHAHQNADAEFGEFEQDERLLIDQSMASGVGDGEEYDDSDLQKAIFSSIEEKARAEEDVFDMMRQAKQLDADEYITVIPRICGALESLCLKCYHNMTKAVESSAQRIALFWLWIDAQRTIGEGFQSLYTIEEQRSLVSTFIKKPTSCFHLLPGIAYGLCRDKDVIGRIGKSLSGKLLGRGRALNRDASMESSSSTANVDDELALPALISSLKDCRISSKYAIEDYIASTDCTYFSTVFADACWADVANMDKAISSRCYALVLNKSVYVLIRSVAAVCLQICMEDLMNIHEAANKTSKLLNGVIQTIADDLHAILLALREHWSDELTSNLGSDFNIRQYLSLIVECSFTAHFLPFLGAFFVGSLLNPAVGVCRSFVFVSCTLQLMRQLENIIDDLSKIDLPTVVVIFLREWITKEYRWIFLFLASSVQALLFPTKSIFSTVSVAPSYADVYKLIDVDNVIGHDVFNCWVQLKPDSKLLLLQLSSHLSSKSNSISKNERKHGQLFQLMDALTRNYHSIITAEHRGSGGSKPEDSIADLTPALGKTGFSWLLDMDVEMMEYLSNKLASGNKFDTFALFQSLHESFDMSYTCKVLTSLNNDDPCFSPIFERTMANYRLLLFATLLKGSACYDKASEYVSNHSRPLENLEDSQIACQIVALSLSAIAISCVTVRYVVEQLGSAISNQMFHDAINKVIVKSYELFFLPVKCCGSILSVDDIQSEPRDMLSLMLSGMNRLYEYGISVWTRSHDMSNLLDLAVYVSSSVSYAESPTATHLQEIYALCTLLLGDMSVDKAAEISVSEYIGETSMKTANRLIEENDIDSMRYFCASLLNIQQSFYPNSRYSVHRGQYDKLFTGVLESLHQTSCTTMSFADCLSLLQVCPRLLECVRLLVTRGLPNVPSIADFLCHIHWLQAGVHALSLAKSEGDGAAVLRVLDYFTQCMRTMRSVDETNHSINYMQMNKSEMIDSLDMIHKLCEVAQAVTFGIQTMRQNILLAAVNCNVKVLLPQIRQIDFISPSIVPNAYTDQGSYTLGFWLWLPSDYSRGMIGRVHLLTRVPEGNEVNVLSLFEDDDSVLCNPTVNLEKKGNDVVMTVCFATISPTSLRKNKRVNSVTLQSHPLPTNQWINAAILFTVIECDRRNESSTPGPWKEESTVQLFVDNELHSSAKDQFGRLPLHQNIVFGRLPSSLHQPTNLATSLLCGSLYWSHSTPQTSDVSGSDSVQVLSSIALRGQGASITISKECDVSVPYEPIVLMQHRENDALSLTADLLQWGTILVESIIKRENAQQSVSSIQVVAEDLASSIHSYCKLLQLLQPLTSIATRVISKATADTTSFAAFSLLNIQLRLIQEARKVFADATEVMNSSSAILLKLQGAIDDASNAFANQITYLCRLLDIHLLHGRTVRRDEIDDRKLLHVLREKDISAAKIIVSAEVKENCSHYENYVVTETAALVARFLHCSSASALHPLMLTSASPLHRPSITLLRLIICGGWPAPLHLHSPVALYPRALFLANDYRNLELSIFPCNAVVKSAPYNVTRANGIWLHRCSGFFSRIDHVCVPKNPFSVGLATEMISPADRIRLYSFSDFKGVSNPAIVSGETLVGMLKNLIQSAPSKIIGRVSPVSASPADIENCHPMELQMIMCHIRALASQLALAETQPIDQQQVFLDNLFVCIAESFESVLSIAGIDPVTAVIGAFNASANRGAGQLDVLSNLLREGDIPFLERISLRTWKQYQSKHKSSYQNYCPIAAIAGDVQITGNRIRALGHFPSIRVLPIELTKMTGRWFYEVTLLTDGLMQIGWADKNFRCDPVCGQGVGDHSHSWALDGLRTKKWNVSCEAYGVRWKPEDVIGVLVDMDLLEMRFYINGEDLGVAFSGFSSTGLFPALSLNVRQCVRVNFGQSRFMYPPNEVDGYCFRSVLLALEPSPVRSMELTRGLSALESKAQDDNRGEEEGSESLSQSALDRQITVDGDEADAEQSTTPPGEGNNAYLALRDLTSSGASDGQRLPPQPARTTPTASTTRSPAEDPPRISNGLSRVAMQPIVRQENTPSSIELEARRQLLIENLIGMGFPVDWALRASEQCDASVSESTAIAWIIERMELEQAKMEELEGGDSRMAEDEDDEYEDGAGEELDLNLLEHHQLQQHLQVRRAAGIADHSDITGVRAVRAGIASSNSGTSSPSLQVTGRGIVRSRLLVNNRLLPPSNNSASGNANTQDIGTWNAEDKYTSLLCGHNNASHRFDADKQAVLCQISELEYVDLHPIILVVKLLIQLDDLEQINGFKMFQRVFGSDQSAQLMQALLPILFRQGLSTHAHPDRLFPFRFNGNSVGDPAEMNILAAPFSSRSSIATSSVLAELELRLLDGRDGSTSSLSSLAVDESSIQPLRVVVELLELLCRLCEQREDHDTLIPRSTCHRLLSGVILECINIMDVASASAYDRHDWLSASTEGLEDMTQSTRPNVLYAFVALGTMMSCSFQSPLGRRFYSGGRMHHPLDILVSPDNLLRVLKGSHSSNTSLSYCVNYLCSLIICRMNARVRLLEEFVEGSHNTSFLQSAEMELGMATQYCVSIAAEMKLLRNFAERLKSENLQRRTYSRYTNAAANFLLQLQCLKRSLGLAFRSAVHAEILDDWVVFRHFQPQNRIFLPLPQSDEGKSKGSKGRPFIVVTQISSNSISVTWGNLPKDVATTTSIASKLRNYQAKGNTKSSYSLHYTQVSNLSKNRPTLVISNVEHNDSYRIESLDPDTLYRVSLTRSNVSPPSQGDESPRSKSSESRGCSLRTHAQAHADIDTGTNITDWLRNIVLGAVEDVMEELRENDDVSVMVSTMSDALFVLDKATCPHPLVISNNGLRVRNTINKKWSTVKSAVRLCTGLHRWEIFIDRCISKNIFIGVVGQDARFDNYVGCDRFGWAFLANRAVWHNKGKLKSYGELFRTGDTVTVTLDLDLGTLSFAVNGKDLGIAVDGLSGPLYPAFSLYNEDDQITLVLPRHANSSDDPTSGTSCAERVLNRLETAMNMCQYLSSSEQHHKDRSYGAPTLIPEVAEELLLRWDLWTQDIGLRSFSFHGDIITVVVSNSLCRSMSDNRYGPGDILLWEQTPVSVIGVGKHRLWIQKLETGDYVGFTRDSIQQMHAKNSLRILRIFTPRVLSSKVSEPIEEEDMEDYITADDITRALMYPQMPWTSLHYYALQQWLELRARTVGVHPLNLQVGDVYSPLQVSRALAAAINEASEAFTRCTMDDAPLNKLRGQYLDRIRLHSLFLLHMNDVVNPLLPLIYGGGVEAEVVVSKSLTANRSIPSMQSLQSLLATSLYAIFHEVKAGFGFRLSWSNNSINFQKKLSTTDITKILTAEKSLAISTNIGNSVTVTTNMTYDLPLLPHRNSKDLYLLRSEFLYKDVGAHFGGNDMNVNGFVVKISDNRNDALTKALTGLHEMVESDPRWRILLGLQCTLLGQFMASMEQAQQAHVTNPPDAGPGKPTTPTWETMLRSVCRGGFFWEDYVPPSHRQSPFHLYSGRKDASDEDYFVDQERHRIFEIFCLTLDAAANDTSASIGRHSRQMGSPANIGGISSWNRFQYFACDALSEVEILFRSAVFCNSSEFCRCFQCSGGTELDVLYLSIFSHHPTSDTSVGMVFLLLQIMHGIGILLGCVLRGGVCIADLQLPTYIWSVLVGDEDSKTNGKDAREGIRRMCGYALRNGILSVVSQTYVDMLTGEELQRMITMGSATNIEIMQRCAVYCAPVHAAMPHVKMFWFALAELPKPSILKLLRTLYSSSSIPLEIFYTDYDSTTMPSSSIIVADPPLSVSSSYSSGNVDICPISMSPEKCTIFLPRYSSLRAVMTNLNIFLLNM